MFENGDVFKYLRESLDKHGVLKIAKPPPYRYILKQLCEQHTKDIYALMNPFYHIGIGRLGKRCIA